MDNSVFNLNLRVTWLLLMSCMHVTALKQVFALVTAHVDTGQCFYK